MAIVALVPGIEPTPIAVPAGHPNRGLCLLITRQSLVGQAGNLPLAAIRDLRALPISCPFPEANELGPLLLGRALYRARSANRVVTIVALPRTASLS